MDINYVSLIIVVVTSVSLSAIAFWLYSRLNKSKYDNEENRVILESIRASLEQKMYVLNDRLVQNEERWRDVNHLLLSKKYLGTELSVENTKQAYYSEFLKANGIAENELIIDDRLVFVLTPFNDRYYDEFMIIKATCEDLGFTCYRGDEKEFKGDIFPEMLRYIVRARIIITNINGRNPNVLYELGVSQALDKDVILISREPKDLPLDIQSQRFVIYSNSDILKRSLQAELRKFI